MRLGPGFSHVFFLINTQKINPIHLLHLVKVCFYIMNYQHFHQAPRCWKELLRWLRWLCLDMGCPKISMFDHHFPLAPGVGCSLAMKPV